MSILSLDLGTKTLGLAISKTGLIANPYKTIKYDGTSYAPLINELKEIINKEHVTTLVLGLPKNMNNSLGFASERSLSFKEQLEKEIDIPVFLVDERLSTVEAEKILLTNDISRKKRKEVIDSAAAMIILDTYLKMKGNENGNK